MISLLSYDGTFEGFLCCVFYSYEAHLAAVDIRKKQHLTFNIFNDASEVITTSEKAQRVWKSLQKKTSKGVPRMLFKAFLSEREGVENDLFHLIKRVYKNELFPEKDYGDPIVLRLAKTVKMVDREKHRMDAFVRFRLTKDHMYMATISPDFNVLPLNASHFKNRYADQKWLIYDLARKYGLYYDLDKVVTVELDLDTQINDETKRELFFSSEELQFQELWKNYFRSTNIASRKNMKLHLRHVPKRYWRYLSEKFEP